MCDWTGSLYSHFSSFVWPYSSIWDLAERTHAPPCAPFSFWNNGDRGGCVVGAPPRYRTEELPNPVARLISPSCVPGPVELPALADPSSVLSLSNRRRAADGSGRANHDPAVVGRSQSQVCCLSEPAEGRYGSRGRVR